MLQNLYPLQIDLWLLSLVHLYLNEKREKPPHHQNHYHHLLNQLNLSFFKTPILYRKVIRNLKLLKSLSRLQFFHLCPKTNRPWCRFSLHLGLELLKLFYYVQWNCILWNVSFRWLLLLFCFGTCTRLPVLTQINISDVQFGNPTPLKPLNGFQTIHIVSLQIWFLHPPI